MEKSQDLKLQSLETGKIKEMPFDDVGPLVDNSKKAELLRQYFLQQYISKFSGFMLGNDSISTILYKTGVAKKINEKITETYKKFEYSNLNKAFHHRYNREIYPGESEIDDQFAQKMLCSPADSYFNIREIQDGKIELYSKLVLDLSKMIGSDNAELFCDGGKFLLFTLKPFHDHTMDYPFNSCVLSESEDLDTNRKIVNSTDLNFTKFISSKGQTTFDENHRVVTRLLAEDFDEQYFYVEVGAINVNSIEQDNCKLNEKYNRGTQKSHFNFGSTIILLLPPKLADQLCFPYASLDDDTSIEIQRGNVVAIPKNCPTDKIFSIANKVDLVLQGENKIAKIHRRKHEKDY
ncbi:phosphatidylserine decarboxylase [Candidatus Gracilibacteria bacterium]|nr:phosphatidylserine decarboxylase [Candidatus Gracilibacteria bacterium]